MDHSGTVGPSPATDFPIFTGGPLYQLQQRLRLVHPNGRRLGLAALYVLLVAWLPTVLLAAVEGLALGPTRLQSFLMDFEVNVRFLVTVPFFLFGEVLCAEQLRVVVWQFVHANLVVGETRSKFEDLVQDTVRLSRSARAEMVLFGVAYLHSMSTFIYYFYASESTWRLPIRDGHHILSLAGSWYFLVAFPLFAVLLWRWLWRIALWWRFLWRTSKLELRLSPAHRDEAGGLGFLSESVSGFAFFAFAVTALTTGGLANFIVYEGDTFAQHQWEVGGLLIFLLLLIAGPLFVFVLRLYEAKESAVFEYGALASRHIQYVDRKWLSAEPLKEDVGIDFRAVAHMGSSVSAVRQMSIIPLYKDDVLKLLIVAMIPFLPLLATLVPMDEVMKLVLKVLV